MSWPPLQDGADEVTMMDVAAGLGQKRKLSPEPSANTAAKHSFFWKRMHSNHGTFIGSNHSTENESNLNAFYDETQQVLEIERTAAQIKCCCIPIELYLDQDHRERYRERIVNEGLNALARQWYQQSIERSCDIYSQSDHYISIESGIMDHIWTFLGDVKRANASKNIKSYNCCHCETNIKLDHVINPVVKKKEPQKLKKKAKKAVLKVRKMIKLIKGNHALDKYLQGMFDEKDIDLLEYF
eukprot:287506_1